MKTFNLLNTVLFSSTILVNSSYALNNLDCLLLYDVGEQKYVKEVHPESCKTKMPPDATFKVPLAVMAFDAGILKDEHTIYYWDGKPQEFKVWEKNHNPVSWIKDSVVWYSQMVAQQLGRERIERYLNDFDYGNKKVEKTIMTFWYDGGMKINAYQQVEFLRKLYFGKLPTVSNYAIEKTKFITQIENDNNMKIWGKTGGDFVDNIDKMKGYYAWFVGAVEVSDKQYIFAANAKCAFDQALKKPCSATLKDDIVLPILKNRSNLSK